MIDTVMRIFPKRMQSVQFYGPVNSEFLVKSWAKIMEQGFGLAYGSFKQEIPKGFLLGMIVPDLYTGALHGLEHTWMVEPGGEALDLLRTFEKDCKSAGCSHVISGLSHFSDVQPWKLRKVYEARGYRPHGEAFSKRL